LPLRSDWSERPCPIARAIDVLGDPWTLLVLRELIYGVHRFEEIKFNTEASDKTLTERLDRMIEAGLVTRRQYSGTVRPRHEYLPTPAAEEALPVLNSLALWGSRHTDGRNVAQPFTILCRSCGNETHRAETCSNCGADLDIANTMWRRPMVAEAIKDR
jgi:DNA-binding HxlR family transcriptional regulator